MDAKNPRTGQSARASKSTAADNRNPTQNTPETQPQARPYRVVIAPDLWRRIVVSVEPATITRQPRSFPSYGEALAYAEGLAGLEGWPILDRTGAE